MKIFFTTIAILVFSVAVCPSVWGIETNQSVSVSRQFIIYGLDTRSRGAISELAEQTKANLLAVLRRPDAWLTPIVINLQVPQANLPEIPPAALRFSQTGSGLKLQIDLVISNQIDRTVIERQLLRAILLEMIYRRQSNLAEGTLYVDSPEWLLDGLLALAPGRDRAPMIEALAVSGRTIALQDFLQLKPELLDPATRDLYRAYSFALLQFLLEMSEGEQKLGRYIDNLSLSSNDGFAELSVFFPSLNHAAAGNDWNMHIERLSAATDYRLLTFAETRTRLVAILNSGAASPDHGFEATELDELSRRKLSPSERDRLNQLRTNLLLLAERSNPALRPIVRQYQELAGLIATGRQRHMTERLARLRIAGTELIQRMDHIDDYMNWFEATQLQTSSGLFESYLKDSAERSTGRSRKTDPLSAYLNALEAEF